MNTSIKSLILTVAFSLSSITTHCVDSNLREENAEAQPRATRTNAPTQRRAARANAQIERRVRNQWVEHLPERDIRVLIAAEQSSFALREAGRLNLPVIPTALVHHAVNTQQAAINVFHRVAGTNSQSASEESKTT